MSPPKGTQRSLARGRCHPFILESASGAISRVQGLPEGNNHPPHDPNERWMILANWRRAIVAQLLAPAPFAPSVAWKKAALASGQHEFTDVKTERIERAIADDIAFLAAHLTRTKKC
jgi:hypothetical protein